MLLEPWIETYTGKKLYFLDPKPEQIEIEDIATALSNECRFGGHTSRFYSVAEHSLLVATVLPTNFRLVGLLHDASEAYLRDIASPIKQYLSNYKEMEQKLMDAIFEKFDLEKDSWKTPEVKEADTMALKCEARQLLPSGGKDWIPLYPTKEEIKVNLKCFVPQAAKQIFLQAFYQMQGKIEIIKPTLDERTIILAG